MAAIAKSFDRKITPVILAGGLGTRLRPVVGEMPKVLAPVSGRPFILYLLDMLLAAGFKEAVLCSGYKADLISDQLGGQYKGMQIRYSQESRPLGTGGALRYALPDIKSDIVLVMNGDSYLNIAITTFIDWFLKKECPAAILLNRLKDTRRFGRVELGNDDRILSFKEKTADPKPGLINAGLYLLKTTLLSRIPEGRACSLEKDYFPGLLDMGLAGFCCEAEFIDIGTPESYARAGQFFDKLACPP